MRAPQRRRPSEAERITQDLRGFHWETARAHQELNLLFDNHQFGKNELIHLVRTLLEVKGTLCCRLVIEVPAG
jgi:hypothetical protein